VEEVVSFGATLSGSGAVLVLFAVGLSVPLGFFGAAD
jgi:hypothetical protein